MATAGPTVTLDDLVRELRIPIETLEQKCTDQNLASISLLIESWRVVAPYLGLTKVEQEDIDTEGGTEAEKRLKLLQKWQEKYAYRATYKQLVEMLLNLGRGNQAAKLCSLLVPKGHIGQRSKSDTTVKHHLREPFKKENKEHVTSWVEYQKKERELLAELLKTSPRNTSQKGWWQWPWKTEPRGYQPCGELLFNSKHGAFSATSFECTIIASVGSEKPEGVRVEQKVKNEARAQVAAQRAITEDHVFPNIVSGIPEGTEVDVMTATSLIGHDPHLHLVSLNLDLTGTERSRDYYLQVIESFFRSCKQSGAMIWYTGNAQQKTGDWCFKDGTISFQELFHIYITHFTGRLLYIVSDCCYSGQWVYTCAEMLDNMGIPPCGHEARKRGILLKVYASCHPDQKPGDPCFSIEGVKSDKRDQRIRFCSRKQISESQTTLCADFTKLVCCRKPCDPCPAETAFKTWKWADTVHTKQKMHILLHSGVKNRRPFWQYIFLQRGDEEYVTSFEEYTDQTENPNISTWGYVLASGWGEDPPQNIKDKIRNWTTVA